MTCPRLTAVLVLYKMRAEESPGFCSLRESVARTPEFAAQMRLLLYDNSPERSPLPWFPAEIELQHDPANGGIAKAFNTALEMARTHGSEWLMLLDQDTTVTQPYLEEVHRFLCTAPRSAVAALPRLVEGGRTHSPTRAPRLTHAPVDPGLSGLLPFRVTAYNSGAVLRTDALPRFPSEFWLDFVDHAVFRMLQDQGGRIWLLESRLQHHLSSEHMEGDESLRRFRHQLLAERLFFQRFGSFSDRIFLHVRRARQTVGLALKVRDLRFAALSARAALGLLGPEQSRPPSD